MSEIYYDNYGQPYTLDDQGNRQIPLRTTQTTLKDGEFTVYDSGNGHCSLCGRLGCHGDCFK